MTRFLHTLFLIATLAALPAGLAAQRGSDTAAAPATGTAALPRPGDRIALKIWNEPEMSDTFAISERGEAILPKLGAMQVTALSLAALQDSLRRAYAVYLRNPSVEIAVLRRVSVQGEVRQPGIYLADLTMGLPEIIARAGGYTEAGNPRNVVIVRDGRRIPYGRGEGDGLLAAELQSGDQVFVRPRNAFARNPMAWIGGAVGVVGTFSALVWPMIEDILDDDDEKTGNEQP
ncbi:MAG TPA: polysaccharide biosynthesis/export family protein [Longimicrobiaceae bacterium]|nr:polysaccharide biosynthesis/export family protein [Longimicrobiaceae bacterium]